MISDGTQHVKKEDLAKYEAMQIGLTAVYRLHATDFDNQQEDPDLYPGRITDEFMTKIPPFVVWTSEMDMYIRENVEIARRGAACGKLLEISNMPGS